FQRTAHSPAARTLSATKVAVTQISVARHSVLVNLDGGPSSASSVSAAGSGSALLSCRCPGRTRMSSGRDFLETQVFLLLSYRKAGGASSIHPSAGGAEGGGTKILPISQKRCRFFVDSGARVWYNQRRP